MMIRTQKHGGLRAFLCNAVFAALVLTSSAIAAQIPSGASLDAIQKQVDLGDAEGALRALEPLLKQDPKNAKAQLLRSSAWFILGDREQGLHSLEKSLKLNPGLRQAWLNRGGFYLSEENYQEAILSFEKARALDPAASDNSLNLGTAHLLAEAVPEAERYFKEHLERAPKKGDAYYLIATNYALAGYKTRALQHLQTAIRIDERARLRARTDQRFAAIAEDAGYQALLTTDNYRPPKGALVAGKTFAHPYEIEQGRMLGAVVDSLTRLGFKFGSRIEVTPQWALIWSDVRIKVSAAGPGRSKVELIAAPGKVSANAWKTRSESLFETISYELAPKIPEGAIPKGTNRPR